MQPTAEQYAAIHTHDRNLVVVAGAGSGKTRVLVERYLALLEANPTWELNALVAVTFTQKAAQEMRDRVRQALQARLFAATSVTDQSRWARLLATMDTARIDTIHALCGALLRANAAEAGLDPRFQILDEINSRLLAEDVVERTLAALLNDSGTVDPTVRLFTVYDGRQIRKTLVEFVNTPLPELPADSDAVLAGWQAHWEQQTKRFVLLALRSSEFESTAQWLAETPFPVGDKLADQARDVQAAMDRLLLLQPNDPLDRFVNSVQHFPNPNLKVGSATAWGNSEVLKEAKRRLKTAREWAITLKGLIGEALNDLDHQAAAWLPLWARLIEQAQGAYRQAKIHNDLLDFDDLEIYTANLLARYPHVRARYLGAEFRHVLVDEFQDTNALQWAIIQALTAPDQPTERGQVARLFVVGDPKQSIYAFRGADVSVFEQTRALLQHEIPLVQSFRAHERLVSLFNHVFGQLLAKSPDSPVIHYEVEYGLPMSAPRPTDAPLDGFAPLEVLLLDIHLRDPQTGDYQRDEKDKLVKLDMASARAWEAAEIAQRIHALVNAEQRPIYDRANGAFRPVEYGDIALLFQTTTSIQLYEEALRMQGIPFVTLGGRGYYSRQEVWDVLALLQALDNPRDDLSLAVALRSPLFTLSDEALYALRLPRDGVNLPLWNALMAANQVPPDALPPQDLPSLQHAYATLTELRQLAGRVSIYELLRRVFTLTGYLAILTGLPEGARRRANVEKLLKKAAEGDQPTLSAFIRYLGDLSDREVREGEADTEAGDSVRLMTVHASKGLEFPMVWLPDAAWERRSESDSLVILDDNGYGLTCIPPKDDEQEGLPTILTQIRTLRRLKDVAERKRLFYVAATRAQDALFISGQVQWDDKDIGGWAAKGWLNWLLDAANLRDIDNFSGGERLDLHADWGDIALVRPAQPKSITPIVPHTPLWESAAVIESLPFTGAATLPPLMGTVTIQRERFAAALTATQVAYLGEAEYDPDKLQRFRRSVLQHAPARVRAIRLPGQTSSDRVSKRQLGEIVHEALRWWRFPADDQDMSALLDSYAWKHGIIDAKDRDYAVMTARGWLRDFQHTMLYRNINQAQRVYRELPFVYRTEKRMIHGIIDVLFQTKEGIWTIADYKSSQVRGLMERNDDAAERENRRLLKDHAKRYVLQVGVYAAAVEQYLLQLQEDVYPELMQVFIHYLRHKETVRVTYKEWSDGLARLESQIGKLIIEDER